MACACPTLQRLAVKPRLHSNKQSTHSGPVKRRRYGIKPAHRAAQALKTRA